ncbi:MAG: DUF4126 domain-containing protein [Acidobacteriota bacterium]
MIPLLTGLGLATAAGLNAWSVLLIFNALYALLPQDFPGGTAGFLASPAMLQIAIVMFIAEFVVTKIPLVDRFWEAAHTLLRPIVGALLALAAIGDQSVPAKIGIAILAAVVTLAAHAAKSTSRLTSTAATRGWTQIALSVAEDVVAVMLAVLLFFQPWLTPLFLAALVVGLLMHWPRVARGLQVLFFRIQHPRRRTETGA